MLGRMPSVRSAITFLPAVLLATHVVAQTPEPVLSPALSFDVSSVRLDTEATRAPMVWQPGGHFTMSLPLQSLVSVGYAVPLYRVVGLPDWVRTTFFDIDARAGRQVALEERPAYYRGLLQERFKMKVRLEEREMPAYALVLARSDGRLGPGLRPVKVDCDAIIAERRRLAEAGERPGAITPGTRPVCASAGGPASLTAGATRLAVLTGLLSGGLERPVLDRTGLTGQFDIDFRSAPLRIGDATRAPADLPSVFTALPEQLGLKLEPITAPVTVLVVDAIQMPTEN